MDVFTPAERSAVMRCVRSENTTPEMLVRRLVHALGYRYRLHDNRLPGSPDLVLPRLRAAIFVHGCFWHQHRCEAAARPKSRSDYWNAKLDKNIARDRKNLRLLRRCGWSTLIIWECQTRSAARLKSRLIAFLRSR